MILEPTNDNVIVRIKKRNNNETTPSGIIIPKKSEEKQDTGEVVAKGRGRLLNDGTIYPMNVFIGDTVIFNKFAGTEIESEEDTYLIIKENDILARIIEE